MLRVEEGCGAEKVLRAWRGVLLPVMFGVGQGRGVAGAEDAGAAAPGLRVCGGRCGCFGAVRRSELEASVLLPAWCSEESSIFVSMPPRGAELGLQD